MRDLLKSGNHLKSSYRGIIKGIMELINNFDYNLLNDGEVIGKELYDRFENFKKEVKINGAPILYIAGAEAKAFYAECSQTEPAVAVFASSVSKLIRGGDLNCEINICAEEHYRNTGKVPVWYEEILDGNDSQIKNLLLTGEIDFNSELFAHLKKDFEVETDINRVKVRKYRDIINDIKEYITEHPAEEFQSKKLIDSLFESLVSSPVPLHEIKKFKTNAQEIESNDKTLADIVKFINKNVKESPSLNTLINIAKEEHLINNGRANQPDADEIVSALNKYWDAGETEIEKAIKDGIFKDIKSNLMFELQNDLGVTSVNKIIKVPQQAPVLEKLTESLQDYVSVYNPVGIDFDGDDNKKYALVEENVYEIGNNKLTPAGTTPNIPENLAALNRAVNSLAYDPIKGEFSIPSEKWDEEMVIGEDGKVRLIHDNVVTTIDDNDVVNYVWAVYEVLEEHLETKDLIEVKKQAEDFILVYLNFEKLAKFDNLYTLRSHDNDYYAVIEDDVILNENADVEIAMLIDRDNKEKRVFKSYSELVNEINSKIGIEGEKAINKVFESHIIKENNAGVEKAEKVSALNEAQKDLNKKIQNKENLLAIAEKGSPAEKKLQAELDKLNQELEKNLQELDEVVNDK